MKKESIFDVILGAYFSEKSASTLEGSSSDVVFRVRKDANKYMIKEAVESLFDVKVRCVRTINVKGKTKRFAGRLGVRSDWKKAYVSLLPGSTIEFPSASV